MTSPETTVIMPAFNRADCIEDSIKSVLRQTHADLELVIVDDGSTDKTAELVSAIDDPRIRYFYQENQGVAAARNLGLAKARGRWVSFCDSDDIYFDDRLAVMRGAAQDRDGLFYSGWVRFSGQQKSYLIRNVILGFEPRFDLDVYQYKNIFPASAVMAKRSCLEKLGGFDRALTFEEDWEYFLRFSDHFPVRQVSRPTFFYRVHQIGGQERETGHHAPANIERSRQYLAGKRIEELMKIYQKTDDPALGKKIYLASKNLSDAELRKKIFLSLKSMRVFLKIAALVAKGGAEEGFDLLLKVKDDPLIAYLIAQTEFMMPVDDFGEDTLKWAQRALASFY